MGGVTPIGNGTQASLWRFGCTPRWPCYLAGPVPSDDGVVHLSTRWGTEQVSNFRVYSRSDSSQTLNECVRPPGQAPRSTYAIPSPLNLHEHFWFKS